MTKKINIGKEGDAFKIGEDGTIVRISEQKQPDNQKRNNKGWIWLIVIAVIGGIGIYAYIESNNSNSNVSEHSPYVFTPDKIVVVESEPVNEDSELNKIKSLLNNSSFGYDNNSYQESIVLVDDSHFQIYSGSSDDIESPLTSEGTYEIYRDSYNHIVLNFINEYNEPHSIYYIKYSKTNHYDFYVLERCGNSSQKYRSPHHYH